MLRYILPKRVKRLLKPWWMRLYLRRLYGYDRKRYIGFSGVRHLWEQDPSRETQRALITMLYHSLEKGLALREPRLGFAVEKRAQLVEALERYVELYGADRTVQLATEAMSHYCEWSRTVGHVDADFEASTEALLERLGSRKEGPADGATKRVSRDEVLGDARIDLERFFASRVSVRQFSQDRVDLKVIRKAVQMAMKTPSVCNRQPWRAHVYTDHERIKNILDYQGGCKGWSQDVPLLITVTAALRAMLTPGERHEGFVDGSLFAMSLMYALHCLGLATCALNCSTEIQRDQNIRAAAAVPEDELLVMLIAVGHYPDEYVVARSVRNSVNDVLTIED